MNVTGMHFSYKSANLCLNKLIFFIKRWWNDSRQVSIFLEYNNWSNVFPILRMIHHKCDGYVSGYEYKEYIKMREVSSIL